MSRIRVKRFDTREKRLFKINKYKYTNVQAAAVVTLFSKVILENTSNTSMPPSQLFLAFPYSYQGEL